MRNKKIQICKIKLETRPACRRGRRNGHSSWYSTRLACTSWTSLDGQKSNCWDGKIVRFRGAQNPKLQKKAIDYALDKLNPMFQNVGSQALEQLSTKIRPKKIIKQTGKILMKMLWIFTN